MQEILHEVQNCKPNNFLYMFAKVLILFLWMALEGILVNGIALTKTKKGYLLTVLRLPQQQEKFKIVDHIQRI